MIVKEENSLKTVIKRQGKPEPLRDALLDCIDPLGLHDRDKLEDIVYELKQQGGEEWAVGEMLQRVINFIGNTKGYIMDD